MERSLNKKQMKTENLKALEIRISDHRNYHLKLFSKRTQ
jgi:hypothetical protein